jgi:hypothetical protein
MNDRHENDALFLGLGPPAPPPELRSEVLGEAIQLLGREARPALWERLWANRGLRLAWATAVVALVVGHLLVTPRAGEIGTPEAAGAQVAAIGMDHELAEIASLPRVRLGALTEVDRL